MNTPPAWLPQLLAIRSANPDQPPAVLVNHLHAQQGVTTDGRSSRRCSRPGISAQRSPEPMARINAYLPTGSSAYPSSL